MLTIFLVTLATLYVSNMHSHVIIFISQYRLDLSLVSLIIFIIIIYIIIYCLGKILRNSYNLRHKLQQWWNNRAYNNGIRYYEKALLNDLSGTYVESYKNAQQALIKPINPTAKFIATVLAYRAAGYLAYDKEQHILDSQLNQYQKTIWTSTKLMVMAETNYLHGQFRLCLDKLDGLLNLDKNHITAKILQIRAYIALRDFNNAYNVLEELPTNIACSKSVIKLSDKIYTGICADAQNLQQLDLIAYRIAQLPHNINLIHEYFHALMRLQEYTLAIDLLAHQDELMSDKLIDLTKEVPLPDAVQQLIQIFELRNKNTPNNVILLLCLGILYFRIQQFIPAKQWLTTSIQINPRLDSYMYLFSIAVALNDTELIINLRQQLHLGSAV